MTRSYTGGGPDGSGGPPRKGVVLGDRYELLEPLGHGGMAEVYRAHDADLSRVVAVKLLPAEQRHDDVQARRLQDEARAAAGLSHPNVVAVHDVGSSPYGVFVVMELLEGRTWREEISQRGRLTEGETVRVGAAVASALAHAHAHGITHRDVNPANVMLLTDGAPKLMDFGIAQLADLGGLTETGRVVGTPAYMSPEQVRGDVLDGRSDVYSLGCALYEALTGTPPFRGTGSADVASVRLHEAAIPPRQLRPELSVRVEDLVLRTLSLHPASRPDAGALAEALAVITQRQDRATAAPPSRDSTTCSFEPTHEVPGSTARAGGNGSTSPDEPSGPEAPPPASASGLRRVGTVLVVLGVLAILVVGTLLLMTTTLS